MVLINSISSRRKTISAKNLFPADIYQHKITVINQENKIPASSSLYIYKTHKNTCNFWRVITQRKIFYAKTFLSVIYNDKKQNKKILIFFILLANTQRFMLVIFLLHK